MVQTAQFTYQGWLAFAFMLLGTGAAAKVFIIGHKRAESVRPGTARAEVASGQMTAGV
ncbi:hypothetical protein [Mobilicoccus massiliensis]|uniref:hypothetical protein n=1 Tax=Mobilicoccus massiliensis TaxID=1522310 RepID=UPI001596A8FA|nr:hypothetical protein [Mobilicoccus massiliensis]